jgi:hypothetical protein
MAMITLGLGRDNVTFTIAPPPAGYPVFNPGETDMGIGLNYISLSMPFTTYETKFENNLPVIDTLNQDLKIVGGALSMNYKKVYENFAVNHGGALAILGGNMNSMLIMDITYCLNGLYQAVKTNSISMFLFANAGLNISFNNSNMIFYQYLPFLDPVEDEVAITTTMLLSSFSGGLQMNLTAGDFIISPYGIYSYSGGNFTTSMTSSMSFEYEEISDQIDNFGSVILGFDILYTPKGITLSSMIQSSEDYDMINISLRKTLGSFGGDKK